MSDYQGPTDQIKKVELTSSIEQVLWSRPYASAGAKVGLEVLTLFIGKNSDITIELSDKTGKKFETIKKKIFGNQFFIEITVPEKAEDELYAEIKLQKHGLNKKSDCLYIHPRIEIKNLKWDKTEARRGDLLKMSADVLNAYDGTEAEIKIFEHDSDGAHDLITTIPAIVKNKKIEADWEFEYHEDTDDIVRKEESELGYNPPEYFFRVNCLGISADSDLLKFKDWLRLELQDDNGNFIPNEDYILYLPDGTERRGSLNSEGYAIEENIPPGVVITVFPNRL